MLDREDKLLAASAEHAIRCVACDKIKIRDRKRVSLQRALIHTVDALTVWRLHLLNSARVVCMQIGHGRIHEPFDELQQMRATVELCRHYRIKIFLYVGPRLVSIDNWQTELTQYMTDIWVLELDGTA